jgi:hypothetical protein
LESSEQSIPKNKTKPGIYSSFYLWGNRTELHSGQTITTAGRLNAGVSKKVSTALTVRATVNDILYTQINRGIINNLANIEANWRNENDTRTVTIALAFRFGKTIADLRRHSQNSAQQEQNRMRE